MLHATQLFIGLKCNLGSVHCIEIAVTDCTARADLAVSAAYI